MNTPSQSQCFVAFYRSAFVTRPMVEKFMVSRDPAVREEQIRRFVGANSDIDPDDLVWGIGGSEDAAVESLQALTAA